MSITASDEKKLRSGAIRSAIAGSGFGVVANEQTVVTSVARAGCVVCAAPEGYPFRSEIIQLLLILPMARVGRSFYLAALGLFYFVESAVFAAVSYKTGE